MRTQSSTWTTICRIHSTNTAETFSQHFRTFHSGMSRKHSGTIYKRLEFPTVLSEQHLRDRLWLEEKIPQKYRLMIQFFLSFACSALWSPPLSWSMIYSSVICKSGFFNYSDVQLTFRLFYAIMTYLFQYQSCSAVIVPSWSIYSLSSLMQTILPHVLLCLFQETGPYSSTTGFWSHKCPHKVSRHCRC